MSKLPNSAMPIDFPNAPPAATLLLRKWIILAGYILGGWALLQSILELIVWSHSIFNRHFGFEGLTLTHDLSVIGVWASPILLLCGCWGFQRHRPWARTLLFIYIWVWICSIAAMRIVEFLDVLSNGPYVHQSGLQVLGFGLELFDGIVYRSIFPAFLFIFLTRPEIGNHMAKPRGGFEPIMGNATRVTIRPPPLSKKRRAVSVRHPLLIALGLIPVTIFCALLILAFVECVSDSEHAFSFFGLRLDFFNGILLRTEASASPPYIMEMPKEWLFYFTGMAGIVAAPIIFLFIKIARRAARTRRQRIPLQQQARD